MFTGLVAAFLFFNCQRWEYTNKYKAESQENYPLKLYAVGTNLFELVFYIRTNAYKVYYQFVLCVFYD